MSDFVFNAISIEYKAEKLGCFYERMKRAYAGSEPDANDVVGESLSGAYIQLLSTFLYNFLSCNEDKK